MDERGVTGVASEAARAEATAHAALSKIAPPGARYRLVYRSPDGAQAIVATTDPGEALRQAPAWAATVRVDVVAAGRFCPLTPPFQVPGRSGSRRLSAPVDPAGWPVRLRIIDEASRATIFDGAGYASVVTSDVDLDRTRAYSCIVHRWTPGTSRWAAAERLGRLDENSGVLAPRSPQIDGLAEALVHSLTGAENLQVLAQTLSAAGHDEIAAAGAEALRRLESSFDGPPRQLRALWALVDAAPERRPLREVVAWAALSRAEALATAGGLSQAAGSRSALLDAVEAAYPGTKVLARAREQVQQEDDAPPPRT